MKKIGIFCADGVEEIECLTAVDFLRRAGVEVTMISVMEKRTIQGAHGIIFFADQMYEEADLSDYDGIVLPGGGGYTVLEAHEGVCRTVLDFYGQKKLTAAICASPSIFARLGILKGRKATVYPGMEVADAADWTGQAVEVSDHVITGQGPAKAAPFAIALIRWLLGDEAADAIAAEVLEK
jgi:4-methyl-5(b-hydroxyethyl)-thiazole monophosphate biosynthesis